MCKHPRLEMYGQGRGNDDLITWRYRLVRRLRAIKSHKHEIKQATARRPAWAHLLRVGNRCRGSINVANPIEDSVHRKQSCALFARRTWDSWRTETPPSYDSLGIRIQGRTNAGVQVPRVCLRAIGDTSICISSDIRYAPSGRTKLAFGCEGWDGGGRGFVSPPSRKGLTFPRDPLDSNNVGVR